MGILATQEPGVLLTAVFDSKSKTVGEEIAALEVRLTELQKEGITGFITATHRDGTKLTVKILPASSSAPPAARGAPAAAKAAPAAKPASGGWGPKSAGQVGVE